jgi:valyl-tRNA synthetase
MGDTAVCVNPTDERYSHLKGKKVIVPLVNRLVPVIFDDYVDKEFGTGALKITPAHDINDYNLGLKHNLEIVDTLNPDGTLSDAAQVFVGLDRYEARKKAVEKLKKDGLLIKEEDYTTRLGFSQRSNAVVEPRISTQWFVKMREPADKALDAVLSGKIKIHPEEKFLATYKYWLENVKDWCISRQLWWGQRIPAWYSKDGKMVVAANEEDARKIFNAQYSILNAQLRQDEDVLDTWFSSWLWPIEVFKGITEPGNKDINYYYPTSVLVTGQDIIFFWVARMIMAGMEYMNERPFEHVYFTGMVRDKQGRKMSKQLGNSPELLDLIDRYGADAVRFGIMISSPAGNDLLFDESSLEQGRNFNNKLWNALKLVRSWESRVGSSESGVQSQESGEDFAVAWFENQLSNAKIFLTGDYEQFRLSEGLKDIYTLIWDDFCSWYLEWIKPAINQTIDNSTYQKTIDFFEELVQLLHPFMPFVTEEIYHQLRHRNEGDDLCIKQFASVNKIDSPLFEQGYYLKQAITAIRESKNRNQIKPKDAIKLYIQTENKSLYESYKHILRKQVNAENITFTSGTIPNAIAVVVDKVVQTDKFFIQSEKIINVDLQKEELLKDLEYLKGFLASVEKKLNNGKFVENAKSEVIEAEKKKKADAEAKIKAIEESLAGL